jgi:hypothetical protein
MMDELAPGIYGGQKGLEAYLAFMGVDSLDELEEKQLSLDDLGPPVVLAPPTSVAA